jgi:hypothetical protein
MSTTTTNLNHVHYYEGQSKEYRYTTNLNHVHYYYSPKPCPLLRRSVQRIQICPYLEYKCIQVCRRRQTNAAQKQSTSTFFFVLKKNVPASWRFAHACQETPFRAGVSPIPGGDPGPAFLSVCVCVCVCVYM